MSNKEILLLVGAPGSGKSTWAKEFVSKNSKYVRINRDSYRLMLFGVQMGDPDQERIVTRIVDSAVETAIQSGKNVILDQTNCNLRFLEPMIEKYSEWADIHFRLFDVDLVTLEKRNETRPESERVPKEVLLKMFNQYLNLFEKNFDFSTRKQKVRKPACRHLPDLNEKPGVYLFDIDGTIAHALGQRSWYSEEDAWKDEVDEVVVHVLRTLHSQSHPVILMSGRKGSEVGRKVTEEWLNYHNIPYKELWMRDKDDNRRDSVIKRELYDAHIAPNYNVIAVFDDRDQVVKMWRDLGLKVFQCEYGNF